MLKRFTDGLIFGSGFAIAFIALWYFASFLIYPTFVQSYYDNHTTIENHDAESSHKLPDLKSREPLRPFHELELDDQIKTSSFIALASYQTSSDGKKIAVIKEFIKQDPDSTIYYKVGDEYKPSSFYPKANQNFSENIIIFFVGSPAIMKLSMTYSGDRIHGLGDIPVELLRNKCKKDNL